MTQMQIAVLVGSLRRDSFNRELASAVGTSMAQQHRRNVLSCLVQGWMDRYVSWVKKHTG